MCFGAVSLAVVRPTLPFVWDETVHLSQVMPNVPASAFDAHRARGIVALAYPAVAAFGSSPAAIRSYLAPLAGVGLLLAYLPWLRLRPGPTAPLAAGLFGSLWVALFYAPAVMPNLYVAFAGAATIGWLLVSMLPGAGRGPLVAASSGMAVAALLRPTDALLIIGPLLLATLWSTRGRLRLAALAALVGGFLLGWAPWVVEAYARFDGPLARLHTAATVDGQGLYDLVPTHLRALSGALLCSAGRRCGHYQPAMLAWWFLALLLAALGVWGAVRKRRATAMLVAVAVASAFAVPYLFTVTVVAPRFLLPAYALVALPAAEDLLAVLLAVRPGRLRVVAARQRGESVAVLVAPAKPVGAASYLRAWRVLPIREPGVRLTAYLAPRP